jgi:hypothetical protein
MSDKENKDKGTDEGTKAAVPRALTGAGSKQDSRCSECGAVTGTKHMEGCKYA